MVDEKKDAAVAKKLGEHDRNIAGKLRVFGSMQIYEIPLFPTFLTAFLYAVTLCTEKKALIKLIQLILFFVNEMF